MNSSEILLLVKLTYGEPDHSNAWFDKLPPGVIENAYCRVNNNSVPNRMLAIHIKQKVLSIMLRQPANRQFVCDALISALCDYHKIYE